MRKRYFPTAKGPYGLPRISACIAFSQRPHRELQHSGRSLPDQPEYSYVDNWVDTDLTELTGGKPLAGPASSGKHLVALLTTPNNQRHVYFAAKSGDLEQLYFNGSSWSKQNLTATTHGPGVDTGNFDFWMAACVVSNDQYVFFASPDLHLHEFSY